MARSATSSRTRGFDGEDEDEEVLETHHEEDQDEDGDDPDEEEDELEEEMADVMETWAQVRSKTNADKKGR